MIIHALGSYEVSFTNFFSCMSRSDVLTKEEAVEMLKKNAATKKERGEYLKIYGPLCHAAIKAQVSNVWLIKGYHVVFI